MLCSAGAPIKKEVADFYYAAGFNIMITYGASETNIPTIGNTPEDITTDTCGVPYPAISLKISDEGEMLIKSPYMMVGYFRDEEATKEAFDKDGWFRTGDIGSIDEKGHVHVTGRLKENIVLACFWHQTRYAFSGLLFSEKSTKSMTSGLDSSSVY